MAMADEYVNKISSQYLQKWLSYDQGCCRLIFSGWFDSDSYDSPGDLTPTQLKSQIC